MNTPARALIAEDEPLLAESLRADLKRIWPSLDVIAQVGDGDSAIQATLRERPDLCFLDIRMPGRSGLEVAQALVEDWPDEGPFPLLVFVTAYDQYAVQAFEAQAVDYLVKPVRPDRLAACVQRLKARMDERGSTPGPLAGVDGALDQIRALLAHTGSPDPAPARLEVIQAGVGTLVHFVPVDEVLYFEAADKYVRVVTREREHLIRLTLRELLPQLDSRRFWQIHRGTIVQARCIASARRDDSGKVFVSLKDRPQTLVASRLYAHLFKGM